MPPSSTRLPIPTDRASVAASRYSQEISPEPGGSIAGLSSSAAVGTSTSSVQRGALPANGLLMRTNSTTWISTTATRARKNHRGDR